MNMLNLRELYNTLICRVRRTGSSDANLAVQFAKNGDITISPSIYNCCVEPLLSLSTQIIGTTSSASEYLRNTAKAVSSIGDTQIIDKPNGQKTIKVENLNTLYAFACALIQEKNTYESSAPIVRNFIRICTPQYIRERTLPDFRMN